MSYRIKRINELIKRELSQFILKQGYFSKKILVTISEVETTLDLSYAKVYISVMPEDKSIETISILKQDIYVIQKGLNKTLRMKKVPKIKFLQEKGIQKAARVEELLKEIDDLQ